MQEFNDRPDWITKGDNLIACPHCGEIIAWGGPTATPSLHFACPHCGGEVRFVTDGTREIRETVRVCSICGSEMVPRTGKYGKFWGCSSYSKRNKCRGKPILCEIVRYESVVALVQYVEYDGEYDCVDEQKARRMERARAKMEHRKKEFWR